MAKANRTCKVCGLKYYFCPDCSASRANPQPKWHINYCSENCKTIFDTVVHFNCNSVTKEEAAEILSKCDLSKIADFEENLKAGVKEIQKRDKKVVEPSEDKEKKEPVEKDKFFKSFNKKEDK